VALSTHCSSLAALRLIKLFVKMLKFSKRIKIAREIENLQKNSIFDMECSKLINYLTKHVLKLALYYGIAFLFYRVICLC
jgi:hypothetical protein